MSCEILYKLLSHTVDYYCKLTDLHIYQFVLVDDGFIFELCNDIYRFSYFVV